jgi:hypothetical protein
VTLTATISATSNGAAPTGTVQFMNGTINLGAASTCTAAAPGATTVSCTATLTTALSQSVPLTRPPALLRIPFVLLWIGAGLVVLLLVLTQRASPLPGRWPHSGRRLGYAIAGLLLFACVAAGFAGCSGGSSSGGPHTDSITAVYSGDANYAGSTSAAAPVTVQ